MEEKRLLRYVIQLGWLKRLLKKELITEDEYNRIKAALMKDYGITPGIST